MMRFPFKIIDLTHTLSEKIPTWDGSCGFSHKKRSEAEAVPEKQSFYVHSVEMHSGIGTHMDAPAHCYYGGLTIDQILADELVLPAFVIHMDCEGKADRKLMPKDILKFEESFGEITSDSIVFVRTDWDKFWPDSDAYRNQYCFPSISKEAALLLLERGIAGIGIDTLSPDAGKEDFPVHQLVLGEGKIIIENATHLDALPETGAFVAALPLNILGGTEAPIRLLGFIP